jgi:hypothetical protein
MQRSIIPANGFFEPDKIHYDKPPYPWYYFQFKDQRLFAFAGIYDIWTDKQTGKNYYSYSLSPVPYERPYQAVSCRGLLTPLKSSHNLRIVSNA